MPSTHIRRTFAVVASGALVMALTSTDAVAASSVPVASGWLGEVDMMVDGEPVREPPIARCVSGGEEQNESEGVTVGDLATYDGGQTTCERADEAAADVAGEDFETEALHEFGGPRIAVRSFQMGCTTNRNGSSAWFRLRGIRGIDVPSEIPPNYEVLVDDPDGGDPLAKVVLNEQVVSSPPDGAMRLNAIRIEPFPAGDGRLSGSIVVGSVHCDPYGG